MSNIYIQEPPTSGKVLLKTTVGDIDVELWSKEAPLACKNFIQLCLDGYYNNTIFHRVVKGFIVQGGDPTGTGSGGESIYGEPFKDEIHSRLRFNRRGLVAMANAGKNDNGSQFFFTLGATPELQKKHTIFGKIGGKTIYNMIKLEEGEIDTDDRPLFPNKIVGTEVLNNSFPEIVPRVTVTKKSSEEKTSKKKVAQGVKNFKLLSFGEEAEDDEEEIHEINQTYQGKKKHVPTLVEMNEESLKNEESNKRKLLDDIDSDNDSSPLPKDQEDSDRAVVDKIHAKLNPNKKIAVDHDEECKSDNSNKLIWDKDEKVPEPPKKSNKLIDEYIKEKDKYSHMKKSLPKKGESREKQTLEMLMRFRQKINMLQQQNSDETEKEKSVNDESQDWLVHSLKCEDSVVLAKDANNKDDDWFEITDPRNALNKRRRENSKMIKSRIKEDLK